jgi:hypothetical protein
MDKKADYPADHKPGMEVPKGGSMCANCRFLKDDRVNCGNKYFIAWNGGPKIKGKVDEYCSDWYMPKRSVAKLMER